MAHFIFTTTKASAQDVVDLFVQEIARLHGISASIVSDWNPKLQNTSKAYRDPDVSGASSQALGLSTKTTAKIRKPAQTRCYL